MQHLYRHLRPELVRAYREPLCSDTFSGFVRHHNPAEHIPALVDATRFLHEECIPRVAAQLESADPEQKVSLIFVLHFHGVNVRHMGRVLSHVTHPYWRQVLMLEMIARVLKNDIRRILREKMREFRRPGLEPYIRVVVKRKKKKKKKWIKFFFKGGVSQSGVWQHP
jgi:hypothetical protein